MPQPQTRFDDDGRMPGSLKRRFDNIDSNMQSTEESIASFAKRFIGIERTLGDVEKTVNSTRAIERIARDRRPKVDPGLTIARMVLATCWAWHTGRDPDTLAAEIFGTDSEPVQALRDAPAWVTRATTNPAMTTVPGWAQEIAGTRNHSVIRAIAPAAVYSRLTGHGVRLDFSGIAGLSLINRSTGPADGGFFRAEGDPLPVRAQSFGRSPTRPYSGGFATLISNEVAKRSTPNGEAVLRQALQEDAELEIDTVLLDANPATAIRPAGLLNGATVVTPAGASIGNPAGPAIADASALLAAIPNISDPVILGRADVALRLGALVPGLAPSVITSPLIAAATLVALDGADFWSGEGDGFDISATEAATIVSTDPGLPVTAAGGGRGTPAYSAWQHDMMAIRLLVAIGWGMRSAGRVAVCGPVNW